jgi:hypothetical protein
MRILVGVLGGALVALMLLEIFISFLLPRRVKRDPRIVRSVFIYAWRPWRRLARACRPRAPTRCSASKVGGLRDVPTGAAHLASIFRAP